MKVEGSREALVWLGMLGRTHVVAVRLELCLSSAMRGERRLTGVRRRWYGPSSPYHSTREVLHCRALALADSTMLGLWFGETEAMWTLQLDSGQRDCSQWRGGHSAVRLTPAIDARHPHHSPAHNPMPLTHSPIPTVMYPALTARVSASASATVHATMVVLMRPGKEARELVGPRPLSCSECRNSAALRLRRGRGDTSGVNCSAGPRDTNSSPTSDCS